MDVNELTRERLANMFDHTCLKAFAREEDFRKLCEEARDNGFKMVSTPRRSGSARRS